MQYWDGNRWVVVPVGYSGQVLTLNANNIPTWIGPKVNIGDLFQGGIVAYLLGPNDFGYDPNTQHGLIVAPMDQSSSTIWGCTGTTIFGADGSALGTGNQNTIDIISGCAVAGIAARICGDLVLNGYNDWYLPSIDELNILSQNRSLIGGFPSANYWSSTEINNNQAWCQFLGGGQQGIASKDTNLFHVRAIRSF